MMEDENDGNDIGSPSPPYEGVIKEDAEKQLESKGGGFDHEKNPQNEVNN